MPFFKTHEVSNAFFKFFLDQTAKKQIEGDNREHPMLAVPLYTGETVDFMLRYYKRSGESSIEDVMEYYPCIVIQDFQPEIDKTKLYGRGYIEGMYDAINKTREYISLPIPLTYKFQVSVVTRRRKEVQGANDLFFQMFDFQVPDCFEFNRIETEEGFVADIVPYRASWGEVPREDRRFENAYDFTLDTHVHAKFKDYTYDENLGFIGGNFRDALERINLTLHTKSFDSIGSELRIIE